MVYNKKGDDVYMLFHNSGTNGNQQEFEVFSKEERAYTCESFKNIWDSERNLGTWPYGFFAIKSSS